MSEWTAKPGPVAPILANSSIIITLNLKSPPIPPYFVGALGHKRPCYPALSHNSLGIMPFFSHSL